jgi:hypothetical protein
LSSKLSSRIDVVALKLKHDAQLEGLWIWQAPKRRS